MATLTLTKLWINLVATGEAVSANSGRDRPREHGNEGEVRTYGGGRQASVTAVGERSTWSFTLVNVTDAQVNTLRDWKGELVQVRDHRGLRFYGTYFAVSVGEDMDPTLYRVGITLQTLSYEEGA